MSSTEANRGPGRPPVGPRVEVRLTPDVLTQVDTLAASRDEKRSDTVRQLIERGLDAGLPPVTADQIADDVRADRGPLPE